MKAVELFFWISLTIVFYTYIGYGIILYFFVKIKEKQVKPIETKVSPECYPEVTLLIAAYNEENIVHDKMTNTLNLDYPKDKLKVIWVTDGSSDGTNIELSKYDSVKVLYEPKRNGKSAALNRGISHVVTPLVVFTDANTMINSKAILEIVSSFSNPNVGCVACEKRIAKNNKDSAATGGEGIYWKYESKLKELDSRLYTTVGAAGELFAIKRELYEYIELDTLLDDFVLSMKIAKRGYKIEYCNSAYAVESGSYNMKEEKKRKIRIAAGGIQAVYRLRELLNPFKYKLLSFQYISHRVLRWTITPILLFALLPLNLFIVMEGGGLIYLILLYLQTLFYIFGILGIISENRKVKNRFLFVPYYFLFMNLNVILGFIYLAKKRKGDGTWEKSRRLM